jgi:hypothetical protein
MLDIFRLVWDRLDREPLTHHCATRMFCSARCEFERAAKKKKERMEGKWISNVKNNYLILLTNYKLSYYYIKIELIIY